MNTSIEATVTNIVTWISFFVIIALTIENITRPPYLTEVDLNKLNVVRYDDNLESTIKMHSAVAVNKLLENDKLRYERCQWLSECTGLKLEVRGNLCLASKNGKKFPITECE